MTGTDPSAARVGTIAPLVGAGAFVAVLLGLGAPGVTVDEPLDVRVGTRYLNALHLWLEGRWSPVRRGDVELVFADNAQHPPLGRLLLGISATAFGPLAPLLGGPDAFGVYAARVAPAAAFGLLVGWLVGFVGRREGRAAGVGTGLAMVFMPRLFAHAHFATLDTILNLTWVGALLAVARAAEARRPTAAMGAAGLVWGLALLTKIHGWLLPPVVLPWVVARLGWRRGLVGGACWMAAGLLVFFAGWPWLWHEPLGHLRGFLGTSVQRMALRVQYFGRVYLDRDVPWHYPWLYFAATVPVGLHALGLIGVGRAWRRRREAPWVWMFLAGILLLLGVFSTGAPVYDGERLFLGAFPLWAAFVGFGVGACWRAAPGRWWRGLLVAGLVAQGWGLVATFPFGLSYYNLLVGGLKGAERLGLELTYWGDAVDRSLLEALATRAEPEQIAVLVPTLHHVQGVATTTPELAQKGIILQDQGRAAQADWLVVSRRTAYWPEDLAARLARRPPIATASRGGVWLAGVWDFRPAKSPPSD